MSKTAASATITIQRKLSKVPIDLVEVPLKVDEMVVFKTLGAALELLSQKLQETSCGVTSQADPLDARGGGVPSLGPDLRGDVLAAFGGPSPVGG